MNSRFGAALIVLLALAQTLSAQEARFGGTFIGAIVCADGIIIGADSRSTFIDSTGKHIGYVDGISKVFANQGTAFAVSGLTSVGDELFPTFVRRNDFLLTRPSNEILFGVSLWLPVDNASQVLLISAGFVDDKPTICTKDPTNPQVCRNTGIITNKQSPSLAHWQSTLKSMPSYQEAARALKQAILESAAADPTVGGPIALLHVRNNAAPEWIENGSQDSGWTRICDIVTDYRHNKTAIGFSNSKEELDRFLSSICPVHK
jgi:hypothetical protein